MGTKMQAAGERAAWLETLAKIEDALYRARTQLTGPVFREVVATDRELSNRMLEAKAAIDRCLDRVEFLRPEQPGGDAQP